MGLSAFDIMMEEWTAAPIIRHTANDNGVDFGRLNADIERDVEDFRRASELWLTRMWARIGTLEKKFEQMAADNPASARDHAEILLWPATLKMKAQLVQMTTAGEMVRSSFKDAMRTLAQRRPVSAEIGQLAALKVSEVGNVQRKARAAMYFHILDLAEKYAPRSRADSIAASVERSLGSYPVVNDILAR